MLCLWPCEVSCLCMVKTLWYDNCCIVLCVVDKVDKIMSQHNKLVSFFKLDKIHLGL